MKPPACRGKIWKPSPRIIWKFVLVSIILYSYHFLSVFPIRIVVDIFHYFSCCFSSLLSLIFLFMTLLEDLLGDQVGRSLKVEIPEVFWAIFGQFLHPKKCDISKGPGHFLVHWSHWTLLEILERWDSAIGARSFRNPPWQSLAPYHFPKCNTCIHMQLPMAYLRYCFLICKFVVPFRNILHWNQCFSMWFCKHVVSVVSWKIQNQYTDSTRSPGPHTLPILWCLCRFARARFGHQENQRVWCWDKFFGRLSGWMQCPWIYHRYHDMWWYDYVMIMYSISYADFRMNDKAAVPRSPWNMFHSERCWLRLVRTERRK